jgi:hypothetical protein
MSPTNGFLAEITRHLMVFCGVSLYCGRKLSEREKSASLSNSAPKKEMEPHSNRNERLTICEIQGNRVQETHVILF